MPPIGATPCSRDAVFTTSPIAMPCSDDSAPTETTATPVSIPIRTASGRSWFVSLSSSITGGIRSALKTARCASSSWATGAPYTAITASPMNFSTVPPKRSISRRTRAWYVASVSWTSSGSARSNRDVNSTRSQNRVVTTLRSSRDRPSASSALPQAAQECAACGLR